MPSRKAMILGAALLALIIAGWIIADLMIVTDEERIEDFVGVVSGTIDREGINEALTYVDPSRQPLTVKIRSVTKRFQDTDQASFGGYARAKLAPFDGVNLHLLRKSIEMRERHADVVVEAFSRRGRIRVDYQLEKIGDRWLVSHVHVR